MVCIAHRDIKPDNLVNRNFSLKMIDFDVAMQVEDEEEMVGRPIQDGGLDGTGDGGAVDVQPNQG